MVHLFLSLSIQKDCFKGLGKNVDDVDHHHDCGDDEEVGAKMNLSKE